LAGHFLKFCVQYPVADPQMLYEWRILMLAMVAAWRWDRNDQLPNGQQEARRFLKRATCGTIGCNLLGAAAALD
jgi:hypothetical protein